jgi:hypothetical protein
MFSNVAANKNCADARTALVDKPNVGKFLLQASKLQFSSNDIEQRQQINTWLTLFIDNTLQ